MSRHLLEDGVARGITNLTGLVAHGRGEAFDYLLGERSHDFAVTAARAAAALMVDAEKAVISINGNTAVLVPEEMRELARVSGALLELNIFHDTDGRREKIGEYFRELGLDVLGVKPDALIPGLTSDRAKVDSRGIYDADVVLVSLEDGDRTEALKKGGKSVIAIDLNPMSRTPQTADIPIVDEVSRALALITAAVPEVRKVTAAERKALVKSFDKQATLAAAERAIRSGEHK